MKQSRILVVLFFIIPFIAGIVYLLSFYPGILTYDSIFQWDQASRFTFNNWHPAYHTLLIWFLTKIKYSPAILVMFQITFFSSVMMYGLSTFMSLGVPFPLLILLDVCLSVIPINGMMEITLWKDVLFGISVLLLTIYMLKIVLSKGAWLASGWNWIFFGLTVSNVTLLRHNGFPVAFGTIFAILLVFTWKKAAIQSLAVSLLYIGIVVGPVYKIFKVDQENTQAFGVLLIHPIAAHVSAGAAFSTDESAYLNRIYPLEDGWPYSCHDATVLFYQGTSFQPVQEDPLFAAKLLGRLTLASPLVTVRHFVCLSSFVWQISQPKGVSLETVYFANQDLSPYPEWQGYARYIDQRPKLLTVREMIITAIDFYSQLDTGKIGWRPAIYLYIFLVSVLSCAFLNKNTLIVMLLIPVGLQTLVIAFSTQLQALRYQYPIYLVSMLFTLPIFYLAIRPPIDDQRAQITA